MQKSGMANSVDHSRHGKNDTGYNCTDITDCEATGDLTGSNSSGIIGTEDEKQ